MRWIGRLTAWETERVARIYASRQRGCGYIAVGPFALVVTLPRWAERADVAERPAPVRRTAEHGIGLRRR